MGKYCRRSSLGRGLHLEVQGHHVAERASSMHMQAGVQLYQSEYVARGKLPVCTANLNACTECQMEQAADAGRLNRGPACEPGTWAHERTPPRCDECYDSDGTFWSKSI